MARPVRAAEETGLRAFGRNTAARWTDVGGLRCSTTATTRWARIGAAGWNTGSVGSTRRDVQIDSIWWDIQPLLKNYYPTPPDSIIYRWPDKETDIVARLVDETRKRGLEVFWNHRISEVDLPAAGEDRVGKQAASAEGRRIPIGC